MGSTCSVKDCNNISWSKGYCGKHYRKFWLYGDATFDKPRKAPVKKSAIDRFMKFVDKTDYCWNWTGSTVGGYGDENYAQFSFNGKSIYGHRWIYEYYIGEIPENLLIHHTCDNTKCVNPFHLEATTLRDNSVTYGKRSVSSICSRKTHCVRGHPFSGDNLQLYKTSRGRIGRRCVACVRYHSKLQVERKNNSTL